MAGCVKITHFLGINFATEISNRNYMYFGNLLCLKVFMRYLLFDKSVFPSLWC
jgi:hypothetical protein